MNWRDKDDLDLTGEDVDAMIGEGLPVDVRGPRLPGCAVVLQAVPTYGGHSVRFPGVLGGALVRVTQPHFV
ncbi:MAG: hypothetical protein ACR2K2_16995 [Mycobacteriales bacterium]